MNTRLTLANNQEIDLTESEMAFLKETEIVLRLNNLIAQTDEMKKIKRDMHNYIAEFYAMDRGENEDLGNVAAQKKIKHDLEELLSEAQSLISGSKINETLLTGRLKIFKNMTTGGEFANVWTEKIELMKEARRSLLFEIENKVKRILNS